jgi:hypothetical protein
MSQTLITRLSKLDAPDREVDAEIDRAFGLLVDIYPLSGPMTDYPEPVGYTETRHYTASVDAAIALAARVLPGWVFDNVGQDFHSVPGGYEAFGWNVELINGTRVQGQAPTLPLAICIALLRAKEASK